MAHPPTPWKMRKTKDGFAVYDATRKEVFIGNEQFKETMEFVVRACNAHEALMTELIELKTTNAASTTTE